jgi:hypothetical protein
MEHAGRLIDAEGQEIGSYLRPLVTPEGEAVLVQRAERLGGGTIVLPARDLEESDGRWLTSYGELSIMEAPPYSPNVEAQAYLDFWKRLGAGNMMSSPSEFVPTGSGPVEAGEDVPDAEIEEEVKERLRAAAAKGVNHHLATVSVHGGTVLLEGYQGDTPARLAAAQAAASVPGVKEVVNMLVIRADA